MMRILLLVSVFTIIASPAAEKGKDEVQVQFVAQSAPADLGQVSLATDQTRTAAFDLPINNLSLPQKIATRVFRLWANDKNVALTTITLPAEGSSFIVLLLVSPKAGYDPIVMRADDPAFRPGDIYFHNNADKTVLGYVGTEKFTLAPAKGLFLRPKGARAEKFYDVGLGVREPEGDRVLVTTRWPEDAQVRYYVFFYVNPATKRVAYRAVDEFVAPPTPAP
jgi:hypothetical protein